MSVIDLASGVVVLALLDLASGVVVLALLVYLLVALLKPEIF